LDSKETRAKISSLREIDMTIPEAITMQIGKKTRYGSQPHPTDKWGYTKQLLAKRSELDKLEDLIALFSELGIENEIAASKWLVLNLNK
jgi:hypothetical protein